MSNSNYKAIVVEITNLREHTNAQKIACTNIYGNNVIVGKDTEVGDKGLFFPVESQIGQEFAEVNDLIRRKDENGNPAGGMFDKNRRVRAQKFRGEKSMGFFAPMSYLENLGIDTSDLSVGDELETYQGFDISTKYVVPTKNKQDTSKKGRKSKRESRIIPEQFHFHFDTAQFGRNRDRVTPDSLISLTWKEHGTSGIAGHVLVKKKLNLFQKALQKIGLPIEDTEYDYIFASRRVIKNDENKQNNHYYNYDIWGDVGESFRGLLHKGEQVYYEILGYLPSGEEIQKGFDYGCKKGEYKVHIYRITMTNPEGIVTELPWHQVVHRAKELGVGTCPEIFYGRAREMLEPIEGEGTQYGERFHEMLAENYVYDQKSKFCKNKVPEEGIVIRIENGDGIENYKMKNFSFLMKESKQLDQGEQDLETQQDQGEEFGE